MKNSRNNTKKYSNSLKGLKVPILETHGNLEKIYIYNEKIFFPD